MAWNEHAIDLQATRRAVVAFPSRIRHLPSTISIELGSVVLDQTVLFKQLRNDMKDDWFPDPLNFTDMIEGGVVAAQIVKNFEGNHGEYVPIQRSIYNLPKSNFTLRYGSRDWTV